MRDLNDPHTDYGTSSGGQLMAACEHLTNELVEGVRHGFFEMTVFVEMMPSKKRRIIVKAGKSYQFIIQDDEVPRK
jgi:hypothetical protein